MTVWAKLPALPPSGVVRPDERLSWPKMVFIGAQHVCAMFGATILVPIFTGFPAQTTIFFSGVGTLIFFFVTQRRIPSYLGSSFAFIAVVNAITGYRTGGPAIDPDLMSVALGGIFAVGAAVVLIGIIVMWAGNEWINRLMPPSVTGAIVALIGLNLCGAAVGNFADNWGLALTTMVAIMVIATFQGFPGRISVFLGVALGWIVAALTGGLNPTGLTQLHKAVEAGAWVGWPEIHYPHFYASVMLTSLAIVPVIVAENTGHVKAVGTMIVQSLDKYLGLAYIGDGLATMVAGLFGGSGTTTYAENIGVMAATRIYSTAAYIIAALCAILLGMSPMVGALINTIPKGVLGGATVILYGMIAALGARIWIESRVDFKFNYNLLPIGAGIIIGAGDLKLHIGGTEIGGIFLGTVVVLVGYHLMKALTEHYERRVSLDYSVFATRESGTTAQKRKVAAHQ